MASFLYYSLDISIVDDEVFDGWCFRLSKEWDNLDRQRQWQLGDPKSIRASGFHVKLTHATLGGALSWLTSVGKPLKQHVVYTTPWQYSKRYKVEWILPAHLRFNSQPELSAPAKRGARKKHAKQADKAPTGRKRIRLG